MKVLGVSLEGSTAIFSALEKQGETIIDLSADFKKMELKDHLNSEEVKILCGNLHILFEKGQFDRIGIIKRGTKGRFAASSITFKIEGLIQLYPACEVEFISPATLNAYFKKNTNSVTPKYSYQKAANGLAFYLLNQA
ncbi:MAG: DUF3010 family protein [Crocinitomix sp.]|nr:DUF3010 family protein [Crocinitomix sp.]